MENETRNLLAEIRRFLAKTGMGPSYFGKQAVGNTELVGRLEQGHDIRVRTAVAVRRFIQRYRPLVGRQEGGPKKKKKAADTVSA